MIPRNRDDLGRFSTENLEERFWEKVVILGHKDCWEWKAAKVGIGYGHFGVEGKLKLAHRMSYQFASGKKIPDGMCVLHTCDNPGCVNPQHLVLGTIQENNQDKARKKRSSWGEKASTAKLTRKQVQEIRELYKPWVVSTRKLATKYGLGKSAIWRIISRQSWDNVE